MEKKYGKALYKVPLDFEFSCPHRDTDAKGGCTFCSEDGSRATQIKGIHDIHEQIKASMAFAKHRYQATGFTAYVQAYTATFAPLKVFREKIESVLDQFPFDSLHLGTRPDCLPNSTLEYLKELSQKVDLWVELGLQTSHDKTLQNIRRGHDWNCALKGIDKLKEKGLQIITHAILGLPGEDRNDMIETAKTFSTLPFDGIKIHNLHIIKNTEMAREHQTSPYKMLSELEYIDLVSEYLQHLPHDMPVMRINTDTPPQELVAPHWGLQKGQLKQSLIEHMSKMGRHQGDHFHPNFDTEPPHNPIKILSTLDGHKTCLSNSHGESYHPKYGAARHTNKTFIHQIPNYLWNKPKLNLLDIGFGLGYNSFLFMDQCQQRNLRSTITALEHHYVLTKSFLGQHQDNEHNALLNDLIQTGESKRHSHTEIKIYWGDARHQSQKCMPQSYDIIFLDPFHEKNNSELISLDFLKWIKQFLVEDGVLICSRFHKSILNSLLIAGFKLTRLEPSLAPIAVLPENKLNSLPEEEILSIQSHPKAQPYRDPLLCLPHRDIVRKRSI